MSVSTINIGIRSGTASLENDFNKAHKLGANAAQGIKSEFDKVDFKESRGGLMLLSEELGLHLPRHVTSFLSTLPGVSAAMTAAFAPLAIIVLGTKLFEAIENIKKFEKALKESADAYAELALSSQRHAAATEVDNLKLRDTLAILNGEVPKNELKIALEEARLKAEELTAQIQKAITAEKALLEKQSVGFWKGLLGDTKTSDIVDFVTQGKDAIAELERQKGIALTAHEDKLVASLQKELDAKRAALRTELETRRNAEDAARVTKLTADLEAARATRANEDATAANLGHQRSPDEVAKIDATYQKQIAEHAQHINEVAGVRLKLYETAVLELKAEGREEKDLLENSKLRLEIAQKKHDLESITNTNKSKLSTGSSHDANGTFIDAEETKRRADENAALEAAALLLRAHQFDVKTQADINAELDKQRDKWLEIEGITAKEALATQEHIIKMQEASGIITKRTADAKIAALYAQAELADQQKRNDLITKQFALVAQLNALTKGGTAGSDADKAAYKHALEEYQKFLLDKEKAKQASDAKINKAEEDAAAKLFAIQKRNIEGITNIFNSGVQSWISGQDSFAQAAQKAFASFAEAAVMGFIKAAEQRLIYHILGKTIDDEDKLKDASASARKVFRSVMDGVPFPINVALAPIAAAGAFAAAMAFKDGGEVPDGAATGIPAILHPREMVLDSALADVVRGAAANKSNGDNTNGNARSVHYSPVVQVPIGTDPKQIEKFMDMHFTRFIRSESLRRGVRL